MERERGIYLGEGNTKYHTANKMLNYERKYQHFEPLTLTVSNSKVRSFIVLVLFQLQVRMLMNVWVHQSFSILS